MRLYHYLTLLVAIALSGCSSVRPKDPSLKTHRLKSGGYTLKIDVPAYLALESYDGIDFAWFGFADATTNNFMGIYDGYAPRFRGNSGGDSPRRDGRVGKIEVVWFTWATNGHYGSETLVRGFYGKTPRSKSPDRLLHVSITSTNEQGVARLEKAAATIRK